MKIQLETDTLILFESQLFRTVTSLIIDEHYVLLVDPNWLPNEIEFIHNYISKIKKDKDCHLLFTHSDYDHIIGYGRFENYKTIASYNFASNPNPAAIIEQIHTFDDEYYIKRTYPMTYPRIDISIKNDAQRYKIDTDNYLFYQAVGHNKDGMISYNATKGILIVGDYLSNIEFPYIYESVAEYKRTLDKLEQIILEEDIQILVTGHGDFTRDKTEMQRRLVDSRAYIQQLEHSVQTDTPFDMEALFQKYHFPKIMTKFHLANIALLKKEQGHFKGS